ncbi:hypothetical protein AUM89_17955 [Cronobacter sakazakii]|nr:hypothetical protein [Cronobacter sakazakii]EGT4327538.1 hypothetical protein [Cronobacter sakazakii]EGT4365149.1 hypothetical protein [Cronobacter sakazakii]
MDIDAYMRHQKAMDEKVYIEEGFVIFKLEETEYEIPLSRLSSQQRLLGWIFHLTEKSWVDIEILRHFMKIVSEHFDYPLYE